MPATGRERPLGIVMLDTEFARPVGDAGNPSSWPFPVRIVRVAGAYARDVVEGHFEQIDRFADAIAALEQQDVCAIISTCGFLVRHQLALAKQAKVPLETSPLCHFDRLQNALPRGRVAVLTINAEAFDPSVRRASAIPEDALVFGLAAKSHFVRAILDGSELLNPTVAEAEWVELATTVQRQFPDVAHWLFECANMPPYSAAVAQATGLPVFDTLVMGRELHDRTSR